MGILNDSEKPALPQVAVAETESERQAVYAFRYQIYVEEMGKAPEGADHDLRILSDAFDADATILYLAHDDEVIATLRINTGPFPEALATKFDLSNFADFPDEVITSSSRLMIAPQWRGTAVLGTLLHAAYRTARDMGSRFDFCYCTPALVGLYEQLGYRRYKDGFVVDDVGYRVPLMLTCGDRAHLKRVRSPFSKVAGEYADDRAAGQWFEAHYPNAAGFANRRLLGSDDFWSVLSGKLKDAHQDLVPLFEGLDDDQVRRFSAAATLLTCKEGDVLIRPGDVGNEMFVLLSGVAEVFGGEGDARQSIAVLGKGQVFGEIAFLSEMPRTAEVRAINDLELLVLTQDAMKRAMIKMPEVSARVLFNLSLTLCERLRDSTRHWLESSGN